MEREKYPEAWIGKAVNIHGAPHAMGVLRDVNEYGITYETIETVPRPELVEPSLEKILGWLASGELSLTIGARYPLEKAQEAHDALEGRQTTGKIVLNP